jgi:DNA-binding response OmpR family regulator
LVLLDLMVPKIAGDMILKKMRASDWGKDIKVLIISNLNEVDAPAGLRDMGIEGYAVKANLSNDQLDRLVDNILKPPDQEEDVVLERKDS